MLHKKIKIAVVILGVALWAAPTFTYAAFDDREMTTENSFSAGTLDITLSDAEILSANLAADEETSGGATITSNGTENAEYSAAFVKTGGSDDLCNELQLTANVDGGDAEYTGSLSSFLLSDISLGAGGSDEWDFTVTRPAAVTIEAECRFNILFSAHQNGIFTGGFYDEETFGENVITTDVTSPESKIIAPSGNTSYQNTKVTITGHSNDTGVGVASVTLSWANYTSGICGTFDNEIAILTNPSSGSAHFDWTYEWTPSANGDYCIKASATDTVGNAEQSPIVRGVTFQDSIAPQLTALSFSSFTIDTSNSSQDVTITFSATDNLTGVGGPASSSPTQFRFQSPSGQIVDGGMWNATLIDGDSQNGTYEATITFPQGAESGIWTLQYFYLVDNVGNSQYVYTSDLITARFPTEIENVAIMGDADAPQLVSFDFSPRTIDTSTGDQGIISTIQITDNLTGINDDTQFRFMSPSGQIVDGTLWDATLIAGDGVLSGTYEVMMTVAQYAESGIWTLQYILMTDQVGNSKYIYASDIQKLGFPIEFENISSISDNEPPQLTYLSFSSATIDTSTGSQDVTVTFSAEDNLTGVGGPANSSQFRFMSPSGQIVDGGMWNATLIAGDSQNGTYEATITFPQNAESGTWTLQYFYLVDNVGNSQYVHTSDLITAGFPTEIENVVGGGSNTDIDTEAPKITEFSVSPDEINTDNGKQEVTVTLHITDNDTGLREAQFSFFPKNPPEGRRYDSVWVFVGENNRISGTANDGEYEVAVEFPEGSLEGMWEVQSVSLTDNEGNSGWIQSSEFPAGSLTEVTNNAAPPSDIEAPKLESLTIEPSSINTETEEQTVTITMRITDNEAGLADDDYQSRINILSPSGWEQSIYRGIYTDDRVIGDDKDGTYALTVTFPMGAESGEWKIGNIVLEDNDRNYVYLDTGALNDSSFPTTIINTAVNYDEEAPTLVSISADKETINTESGEETVTFTVEASDDFSGAEYISISLKSESEYGYVYADASLEDGNCTVDESDSLKTVCELPVVFPRGAKLDEWIVDGVNIFDQVGRSKWYDSSALSSFNPPTITNTAATEDTEAPKVESLTIEPSSIDTETEEQTVTITMRITDNLSGVDLENSDFWLLPPSGDWNYEVYWSLEDATLSGTVFDGVYTYTVTFPKGSEEGEWKLSGDVEDVVRNEVEFEEDEDFGDFPRTITNEPNPIVLNEFLPNPAGSDTAEKPNGEWVELYNTSATKTMDMSGYLLKDASENTLPVESCRTDTGGVTIAPYGFLVVYRKGSDTCTSNFSLNNDGDTVSLFDSGGAMIDSYTYSGSDFDTPSGTPGSENENMTGGSGSNSIPEGKSFVRYPDGADNWIDPIPTPGAENTTSNDPDDFREYYRKECFDDGEAVCSDEFLEEIGLLQEDAIEEIMASATDEIVAPADSASDAEKGGDDIVSEEKSEEEEEGKEKKEEERENITEESSNGVENIKLDKDVSANEESSADEEETEEKETAKEDEDEDNDENKNENENENDEGEESVAKEEAVTKPDDEDEERKNDKSAEDTNDDDDDGNADGSDSQSVDGGEQKPIDSAGPA